jgi:hypothetical protein
MWTVVSHALHLPLPATATMSTTVELPSCLLMPLSSPAVVELSWRCCLRLFLPP